MAWTHMPQPQQRGAQIPGGKQESVPGEAVGGREGMGHRYADLDVSPTGQPQPAGIDYPATDPPERHGDIAPTVGDDRAQGWDDVVQPENHARQADGAEGAPDKLPLPEGK